MGLDASIYQNIRTPQVELPSPFESAKTAMTLSQLGMNQQKMARELQTQEAIKQAYSANVGPDGKINRDGLVSTLSKLGAPEQAMKAQEHFLAVDKSTADAQAAKAEAAHKTLSVTVPTLEYLLSLPDDQAAKAFPSVMKQVEAQGVPMHNVPPAWDRGWAKQGYLIGSRMKEQLDAQKVAAETRKTNAETGKIPYEIAKIQAETDKAQTEKEPKQNQYAAALYGQRAAQAEGVFGELAQKGYDPTTTGNAFARNLPGVLEGFKGEDTKRQDQAERNFVNAILRRESGAAISQGEFANAEKQYFPRVGDTPEVIRQKEENRKTATAALNAEGAPASSRVKEQMSGIQIGSSVPVKKSGGVISEANASGERPALSAKDQEAISWAKSNFKDPRAKKILRMHGMY